MRCELPQTVGTRWRGKSHQQGGRVNALLGRLRDEELSMTLQGLRGWIFFS
jgi:hypothetical protein